MEQHPQQPDGSAFPPGMRWHADLSSIAAKRGYKQRWIGHMYRTKFGTWPIRDIKPMQPSREVLAWVRSRNIAWAKSKRMDAA
jgi:DNA repair protein RadD